MECPKNLREQERHSNPPAMPVRRGNTPAKVIDRGDSDSDSQDHSNRLIADDILCEYNRKANKQDCQDQPCTRLRIADPANRQDHHCYCRYGLKLVVEFFLPRRLRFPFQVDRGGFG